MLYYIRPQSKKILFLHRRVKLTRTHSFCINLVPEFSKTTLKLMLYNSARVIENSFKFIIPTLPDSKENRNQTVVMHWCLLNFSASERRR